MTFIMVSTGFSMAGAFTVVSLVASTVVSLAVVSTLGSVAVVSMAVVVTAGIADALILTPRVGQERVPPLI